MQYVSSLIEFSSPNPYIIFTHFIKNLLKYN